MKFNKKLSAGLMAGVMALSLSAPALAAADKNTTKITATYTSVNLNVTVPATGKAVINPYGLPYAIGNSSIIGQQIATAPLLVQNKSAVPLKVSATVTGKQVGDFKFAADVSSATDKSGCVVFQMFGEEAETISADTVSDTETINALAAALPAFTTAGAKDITITAADTPCTISDAENGAYILTLREGSEEKTLQMGGAAFFRLAGNVVKSPVKSVTGGGTEADPWATTDGFEASIAFTFEPNADGYFKDGGTVAAKQADGTTEWNANNDKITASATAKLTLTLPDGVAQADISDLTWGVEGSNGEYIDVKGSGLTATVSLKKAPKADATAKVFATYNDANGLPHKTKSVSIKVSK